MADDAANKLTPVLMVEEIEPCLDLWVNRLGWTKTVEVPEGDKIGFVMLMKDGAELMYQSFASVAKDHGEVPRAGGGASAALFIEVPDLEDVERRLAGYPIAMPRRRTFYGMDEIGVNEAGGHLVIFAHPSPK